MMRSYRRSGITDMRAALAEGGLQYEPRRPESWRSSNDAQNDLPCFMPSISLTSYAPCFDITCSAIALRLKHCDYLLSALQCALKLRSACSNRQGCPRGHKHCARESKLRCLHA